MTREERITRLSVGIIRALNYRETLDLTDQELLWRFDQASRPLAEALLDVIEDMLPPAGPTIGRRKVA